MLKSAILALLTVASLAAPAAANPWGGPQQAAKQVVLPRGATRTQDYGTHANALIIPTYHERQAPHTILVGNREYARESFNQSQGSNGLVNMRYKETADSSMRAAQAAYNQRLAQSKARSW